MLQHASMFKDPLDVFVIELRKQQFANSKNQKSIKTSLCHIFNLLFHHLVQKLNQLVYKRSEPKYHFALDE